VDVTFSNGLIQSAKIIGIDLNSDLAIIQVDQLPDEVSPLPLEICKNWRSDRQWSRSEIPLAWMGLDKRGHQRIRQNNPALTPFSIPEAIKNDAAINPGNSGEPLLDLHGRLGINAQIETDGQSQSNSGSVCDP
jgi:S1-C subfamily serine protease